MKIITLSREFGSGGREIAKRLADELHLAYYDKEILMAIAEQSGLDIRYIKDTLDSGALHSYPISFARTFSRVSTFETNTQTILAAQHRFIREVGKKGDCIIVGRGADSVLAEYNPFRIFVYADNATKVRRCHERDVDDDANVPDKELLKRFSRIDRARAENHNFISETRWGDKNGYDLCINTSGVKTIKSIVPSIAEYIEKWYEGHDN
ncbi:MAG: cytidylate kinase-like family protein [Clostridia bacterium]|nr:cytidylate kinase-like family protein [Clostridia bacterium]